MYVTPILLLLLISNVFADGSEDWQGRFSSIGVNTKETSCVVQSLKINLDTLLNMANEQQNEINQEATDENKPLKLTPFPATCQIYYLSNDRATSFDNANALCTREGMMFATLDTDAKIGCIREVLAKTNIKHDYWIAASNRNSLFYKWVTTGRIARLDDLWEAPSPSTYANRCVYMRATTGLVRDDQCSTPRRFICESA